MKRILCLAMAFLTACTTARPRYTWRDLTSAPSGANRPSPKSESWGVKADLTGINPEIVPGFLLSIECVADPKINGDYRVDFNGGLQLPYNVTVNTTDLTLAEVKRKILDAYLTYWKTPSDIDLKVKERRYWVDVRGLVEKPGRYLAEPESSLDTVIGMAGGTSKEQAPLYVRIQKGKKDFIFDLSQYYNRGEDHPQILGWLGGETLFFQKENTGLINQRNATSPYRPPIYMMGEVRKPGEYTLNPGSDLLDSLVLAGGFTERADLDTIEIIRRTGGHKRVYEFSWNDLQEAPTPVQGDVIYVRADSTTKFERHAGLWVAFMGAMASVVTAAVLVLSYNNGRI